MSYQLILLFPKKILCSTLSHPPQRLPPGRPAMFFVSWIFQLSIIYLPIYPTINLSIIYLSTYLSIHPSIYLSIHLSIHPSIYLSLCIEIYIYMHCICIMYVRLFQNKKPYATEQFVASASSGASSAGSASGVGGQPPYVDMVQTT